MELVDTHCHPFFAPLRDDLDGVLARAAQREVLRLVVPAYDLDSWSAVRNLKNRRGISIALGLHPWVSAQPLTINQLREEVLASGAVAIGEIGLDYLIENADQERQKKVLKEQLDLAASLDLPVLLHCRGAFDDLLTLLRDYQPALRGILHAFSKSTDIAAKFIDAGLHIGLGGAITRPHARKARQSAQNLPLPRLVLETDAPSIGLEGIAPQDVEPHHTADVAVALAQLRGLSVEEIANITTTNAKQLLHLD